jgi:hypothetical protein
MISLRLLRVSDSYSSIIQLAEGRSTESEEGAPGIVLDWDEQQRVIGMGD